MSEHRAIFDMLEFGCTSCMYAIEKIGRKTPGVSDIFVDLAHHEIRVDYDGTAAVLNRIRDVVILLGHDIKLREDTANPVGAADSDR